MSLRYAQEIQCSFRGYIVRVIPACEAALNDQPRGS